MAFQFTRDKSNALMLILSGDVDLEITPKLVPKLYNLISREARTSFASLKCEPSLA